MTKFHELIEAVADEKNFSVSTLLFRAKLLAGRLKSDSLREWVRDEIEGYPDIDVVPEYRVVYPAFFVNMAGYGGAEIQNVPVGLDNFPNDWQETLGSKRLRNSVAQLEQWTSGEGDMLYRHYDPPIITLFRQYRPVAVDGFVINGVYHTVHTATIRGILQTIRSRLLDFLIELQHAHPELETDPQAISEVPSFDVDRITQQIIYQDCSFSGSNSMGDTYSAGQAGAQGPGAQASDMTFNQIWQQNASGIDLSALQTQLAILKAQMIAEAKSPEHYQAIAAIAAAEDAAKDSDGPKALERLKAAGGWALKIAEKIAVPVAVLALKAAFGV